MKGRFPITGNRYRPRRKQRPRTHGLAPVVNLTEKVIVAILNRVAVGDEEGEDSSAHGYENIEKLGVVDAEHVAGTLAARAVWGDLQRCVLSPHGRSGEDRRKRRNTANLRHGACRHARAANLKTQRRLERGGRAEESDEREQGELEHPTGMECETR
eukprot:CAMPEP_0179929480 /NCGR_PEP_ID=MMETSP0983-20121128/9455_1 /TAXON_ID=483367 /ORGANISM="non described non described, Strain CCMP 2436" /LENGTH=156 /DNA_ID=CAMNT_0021833417 /DNA_START=200 /DNA_END=670 /DNA_ORIENTATION=-